MSATIASITVWTSTPRVGRHLGDGLRRLQLRAQARRRRSRARPAAASRPGPPRRRPAGGPARHLRGGPLERGDHRVGLGLADRAVVDQRLQRLGEAGLRIRSTGIGRGRGVGLLRRGSSSRRRPRRRTAPAARGRLRPPASASATPAAAIFLRMVTPLVGTRGFGCGGVTIASARQEHLGVAQDLGKKAPGRPSAAAQSTKASSTPSGIPEEERGALHEAHDERARGAARAVVVVERRVVRARRAATSSRHEPGSWSTRGVRVDSTSSWSSLTGASAAQTSPLRNPSS